MDVRAPLKEIRVWGKVATLRRARKGHECAASGRRIEKGEEYYCISCCGAGLKDKIFPDRVRVECINDYLNFGGNKECLKGECQGSNIEDCKRSDDEKLLKQDWFCSCGRRNMGYTYPTRCSSCLALRQMPVT